MYTHHFKQIISTSALISIFKRFTIVFVVAAALLFTASNAFAEALSYNNLTSYYNPVWYMGLNDAQGSMSVVNTGSNTSQGAATDVTFGTQGIIGTAAPAKLPLQTTTSGIQNKRLSKAGSKRLILTIV